MYLYEIILKKDDEPIASGAFISVSNLSGRKALMEEFGFGEGEHTHVFYRTDRGDNYQINIWYNEHHVIRTEVHYDIYGRQMYKFYAQKAQVDHRSVPSDLPFNWNRILARLSRL